MCSLVVIAAMTAMTATVATTTAAATTNADTNTTNLRTVRPGHHRNGYSVLCARVWGDLCACAGGFREPAVGHRTSCSELRSAVTAALYRGAGEAGGAVGRGRREGCAWPGHARLALGRTYSMMVH